MNRPSYHNTTPITTTTHHYYDSSSNSNQFYQMLTRIRELQMQLNQLLRNNQTLYQDNCVLEEQIGCISGIVHQEEGKIRTMREVLWEGEQPERAMGEYEVRLQQLAGQVQQLQEIVGEKNRLHTTLQAQHQQTTTLHHKHIAQSNQIMYLLNQITSQISTIIPPPPQTQHSEDALKERTLLLKEFIHNSSNRVQAQRNTVLLLRQEGDARIVEMRRRRHEMEGRVQGMQQRISRVSRGEGNCMECKVEVVIDDLLAKEDRLRDQIEELTQANEELLGSFESRLSQVRQKLRGQEMNRRRFKQQLNQQLGVLRGELMGCECRQKQIQMRLTRILEQQQGLSHHQTYRDSHILEQIRQLQCENRQLQAQFSREQTEMRLIDGSL